VENDARISNFLNELVEIKMDEIVRLHMFFVKIENLNKLRSHESFGLFMRLAQIDYLKKDTHIHYPHIYDIGLNGLQSQIELIDGLEYEEYLEKELETKNDDPLYNHRMEFGYGREYSKLSSKLRKKYTLEILQEAFDSNLIEFKDYPKGKSLN